MKALARQTAASRICAIGCEPKEPYTIIEASLCTPGASSFEVVLKNLRSKAAEIQSMSVSRKMQQNLP